MQIFSKTDKGIKRHTNQDVFVAAELENGAAFAIVCDGMGGANAGNIASETAVKTISDYIIHSYRVNMDSMDIEKMLTRDQARKRKYTTLSDIERNRMIQDYKLDLMQSRIDNAIVAIPESFYIEKTVYTQTEGSVSVIQWFKYDTFKEKKRYTYSVQKRDEVWHIYDYTVENLGTE